VLLVHALEMVAGDVIRARLREVMARARGAGGKTPGAVVAETGAGCAAAHGHNAVWSWAT